MATYGSDEEQVEALKRWWNDNGNSLLTGVLFVLALFFGVRWWQGSQASQNGVASDLYQQIADLASASMSQTVSEENLAAAQGIYAQLKDGYADSIYTRYAALMIAKFQVDREQLDAAAAELQWILDNPELGFRESADEELFLIARLRLARIKIAQGQGQAALDLLAGVEPGNFEPGYAEAEGDALLSLDRRDDARAAYERALAASITGNTVVLQLKLQDLGVSPAATAEAL